MNGIILYYKYVEIEQPERIAKWQQKICSELGLTGRILLGTEGINGTLGGKLAHLRRYEELMEAHPLFGGIDFKESDGSADDFPRLHISVRREIVNLGIDPKELTIADGGVHLEPDEFHKMLDERDENTVVIDCRNDYEAAIGTFRDAMVPDKETFRDFPAYVDEHLDELKGKKVLMACTGGIRCERASGYLKKRGIDEVYQAKGGIVRYTEKHPEGHFRGKLYVFDKRIAVKINDDIIGTCELCENPCDDYTNCEYMKCNKHFISCSSCMEAYKGCCSPDCTEQITSSKAESRSTVAERKAAYRKLCAERQVLKEERRARCANANS